MRRKLPTHRRLSREGVGNGELDRSRVVETWRAEGLVCLQCAPGES